MSIGYLLQKTKLFSISFIDIVNIPLLYAFFSLTVLYDSNMFLFQVPLLEVLLKEFEFLFLDYVELFKNHTVLFKWSYILAVAVISHNHDLVGPRWVSAFH